MTPAVLRVSTERLQKLLAGAGVASRRAAEHMILAGRVRVNGRIVSELGAKADPRHDRVEVDGTRLVQERPVYYLLHKPRGVVTTLHDPEGRPTVAELLTDVPERVFPVGRLDFHTSGALLLTNDGELAHALLHPSQRVPRTYSVKLRGKVENSVVEALRRGVSIGRGEIARPEQVAIASRDAGNTWLTITLTEGKNREVHRMIEAVDHRVSRLARISFAGIDITGLPAGAYRILTNDELRRLKKGITAAAEASARHPAPPRSPRPPERRTYERGAQFVERGTQDRGGSRFAARGTQERGVEFGERSNQRRGAHTGTRGPHVVERATHVVERGAHRRHEKSGGARRTVTRVRRGRRG